MGVFASGIGLATAPDAGVLDSRASSKRGAATSRAGRIISTGTATLRTSGAVSVGAAALGAVWGGTAVVFGARVGAAGGFETLGLGVAAAPDAGASNSRGSSKRGASPLAPPPPPAAATSRAGRIISTGTATLRTSGRVSVGTAALGEVWSGTAVGFTARVGVAAASDAGVLESQGSSKRGAASSLRTSGRISVGTAALGAVLSCFGTQIPLQTTNLTVWSGTATVVFGARIGAVGGFEILGLGVAAAPDAGASKSRGSSKRDATAGGTVSVGTAAMLTG